MEQLINEIKDRKAIVMSHISEDKGRFGDPFLGQFMRGRVAVEEDEVEWLDKLIAAVK